MKRVICFIVNICFFVVSFAQEPLWIDAKNRNIKYPTTEYFVGFAQDVQQDGETIGKALERVKNIARVEAISTIQIKIKNTSYSDIKSDFVESEKGVIENVYNNYRSQIETSTDFEIPTLKIESWIENSTKKVMAFAYARKSEVIRLFKNQISVGLQKAESALINIEHLEQIGQKTKAKDATKDAILLLEDIEYRQKMLLAVDNCFENNQEEKLLEIKQNLYSKASDLQYGVNVYLQCTADCFSIQYPTLESELKGELSKINCSFINNKEIADYEITIKAIAREYNSVNVAGYTNYYVYVDANILVNEVKKSRTIYENTLSLKGGHTHNYQSAAYSTYKELSKEIAILLKQYIK